MGLFNRAFGGANGVRETIQLSYANHVADVRSGKLKVHDPSEAHFFGLYGALSTRYWARGVRRSELQLVMELSPFCAISEEKLAVDMLAEYVVYQERPSDAQVGVLRTVLNSTAENLWEGHYLNGMVQGVAVGADWSRLLTPDIIYVLRNRCDAANPEQSVNDKAVITCPACTQKLRVRKGPNLVATCPRCNREIDVPY